MLDPYASGVLSVIAAALVARLAFDWWRHPPWQPAPLLDMDAATAEQLFVRLRGEIMQILNGYERRIEERDDALRSAIVALSEEIRSANAAEEQNSERISRLEREPDPCAGCPVRRGNDR
jgi:hypothetical protein